MNGLNTVVLSYVFLFQSIFSRKKVIGLDDLLSDFYQVKGDIPKKGSKRTKIQKSDESDDDLDTKEAEVYNYVAKCQQQVGIFSFLFFPVGYGSQSDPNIWQQ